MRMNLTGILAAGLGLLACLSTSALLSAAQTADRAAAVSTVPKLESSSQTVSDQTVVTDLRCNNETEPLGVETPQLSWKLSAERRDVRQTAWQVRLAGSKEKLDTGEDLLWDSGKVSDGRNGGIRPGNALFKSSSTYWWKVRIWDGDGIESSWSEPAAFSTGLLKDSDWQSQWITWPASGREGLPYLRGTFSLKELLKGKKLTKAFAHVCGLGNADLFVNGSLADSTRILDPAQTNYEQYALYSSFDITPLLEEDANCVGVMISNGWFNQGKVFVGIGLYGRPMLRLQLNLCFEDGTQASWGTSTSWTWHPGPLVSSNIYSGEVYDARLALSDWCKVSSVSPADASPDPTDEGWQQVVPATESVPPALRSMQFPPIRMGEAVQAQKMWMSSPGRWVYDFGVNSTGNIRLNVSLPEGTVITVTMSEETSPSGGLDYRSTGTSVVPVQTETYICSGSGNEIWTPRNSYHGFRYAELSCSDVNARAGKEWLEKMEIHTDLEQRGHFECDNEQLNRLHELALRTFTSNMQGVPIDCPHREKCGWLGDVHAYLRMGLLNFEWGGFLHKYLEDIRTGGAEEVGRTLHHLHGNRIFYQTKKESGIPYMIAPGLRRCGVASPDWGTAVVQIPWALYVYNGDKGALEEYYDAMKQWTDYVSSLAIDGIIYQGLGDWCPTTGTTHANKTAVELTSSAFHFLDLSIMRKAAAVLGKKKDERNYAVQMEKSKAAFLSKFYHPLLHTFGTQTADAMALDLGLCPEGEEEMVAQSLTDQIKKTDGFFRMGIFGLGRVGSVLSRNGHSKEAFATFTKTGNNSFAWMWDSAGATSLWETLPVSQEAMKSTVSSSHSHPMQAGFDSWFYEDLAGIRPCETGPGFRKVILQPDFESGLNYVSAEVNGPFGPVSSGWRREGDEIHWKVSIPAGSSGQAVVRQGSLLRINGEAPSAPEALRQGSRQMDCFSLGSGTYEIILKN